MSRVDWLRDELPSRLSAVAAAQGLGRMSVLVRRVPVSLGWDEPVTAASDGRRPGRPLHAPLFLSPNVCQAPAVDPGSREAELPGRSGVVAPLLAALGELVLTWVVMHLFHIQCLLYLFLSRSPAAPRSAAGLRSVPVGKPHFVAEPVIVL